jgi:hypothetical protein
MNNKDIRQFNHKKQRHGYWEYYTDWNSLFFKAFYHNDKLSAYEEYYDLLSTKLEKTFYII